MYGCESWTIKKAEHWWIDAFGLWCWRRFFESLLHCKGIKPVTSKENSPEYSLEGLMLKFQYFGHLMRRTDSLEKTLMLGKIEGRRRGWQRTRWLDGIPNSMHMSLNKLREVVNREASRAAVHGVTKSWTCWATELNCTVLVTTCCFNYHHKQPSCFNPSLHHCSFCSKSSLCKAPDFQLDNLC